MPFSYLVKNLNNDLNKINNDHVNIKFYGGLLEEELSNLAKNNLPYGKVAILYTKDSYISYGQKFSTALKSKGNSVTHLVLPDNFADTIESYSHVFNLAEDVRLIVATNKKFFGVAKYFAKIRETSVALVASSLNDYDLLCPTVEFLNFGKKESVSVNVKTHVLFDENMLKQEKDFADCYAFVVSHALALVDYRANCLMLNKKINKDAFIFASRAITSTYPLFTHPNEEKSSKLFLGLLYLELANNLSKGEIYNVFSCRQASLFMKDINLGLGTKLLLSAKPTSSIYKLAMSDKYDKIMDYANFLTRADWVSKKLKMLPKPIVEQLVFQSNVIRSHKKNILTIKQDLTKDVDSFVDCSDKMISTFTALGGDTDIDAISRAKAIKHSGDIILNGMSLVRESGIAEHIIST